MTDETTARFPNGYAFMLYNMYENVLQQGNVVSERIFDVRM